MLKRALRRQAGERRNAIDDRAGRSAAICARLVALPIFQAAASIHCSLPIRSEVDTRFLIDAALAAGKAVAVPVVGNDHALDHSWIDRLDAEAFVTGPHGILQPREVRPAAPGSWDLTVAPLLAFDRAGYRLGYGKGLYDRLLAQARGVSIGVAFAAQEEPCLPREPHDVPLDIIVTEYEIIQRRPGAATALRDAQA
ncbi:MAG: 5-formyltetrahydrofolate cyclo-ligase [Chloroflexaceae bacterium]|nr:5-formyltetrahydrofolate cyclo-ligase [Chloroflexaceae bacterium]